MVNTLANNCYFEGRIVGTINAIDTFMHHAKREEPPYFSRVWSININYGNRLSNDMYEAYFTGECAWSIHTAFMSDALINLQSFTTANNCSIEMYSEEEGCCFSEHVHYIKGHCEEDNTVDLFYINGADFETYEEYKEYYLKHSNTEIPDEAIRICYQSPESIQLGGHEFLYNTDIDEYILRGDYNEEL